MAKAPKHKGRLRCEERLKQQAKCRRGLLKKLDKGTREFAVREFAKLGLFQ
jgi:hypothetical protein